MSSASPSTAELASELAFTVQGDRIAVIVDEQPKELGGIIIPDTIRDRPSSGLVVQAPLEPELVGRRILFGESSGIGCQVEGEAYLLLDPSDILALTPRGTPAPFAQPAVES